ncbi:MAG TPA: sigma-70 family RNA polymerase sigma factor [Pyrinomonadaceae bacterium]|nr:sigma-70 family RNA polymerase sigma factor [Pyrinomonadaceae bacterium]
MRRRILHKPVLGFMDVEEHDVTSLLRQWSDGDQQALGNLLPIIYDELRRVAHQYLHRERHEQMLETTALVHEAYLKLIDQRSVNWQNRAHFFAIAAQAMRRILIDNARKRGAAKREGEKIPLDDVAIISTDRAQHLLALDDALQRLEQIDPQQSKIVELRYFGGLTIEETAEATNLSPATVKREWAMARAWLYHELQ